MLVARGQVITLIRPKKHSIHPAGTKPLQSLGQSNGVLTDGSTDVHILLNTIQSPSIANSSASASWIPVCLPKFNASGFVNAYIEFLRPPDDESNPSSPTTASEASQSAEVPDTNLQDQSVALVCISGGGDFESIRGWCNLATEVSSSTSGLLLKG